MAMKPWITTSKSVDRHAMIYVAGHRGLVDSALARTLGDKGYANLLTRTHAELDLTKTIAQLAQLVKQVTGYVGEIVFDIFMPDGTPRKLMDVSRLNAIGWHAKTGLGEGLGEAYRDFLARAGA